MRDKAASPTGFWPVLRGPGSNWNSQGVPAALWGKTRMCRVSPGRKTQKERETVSALSADQSLSNDLME